MANFGTQIKSLTGIDITDGTIQGYINDWLTDGVREVQNVLPPDKLEECTNVATLNNSSPTLNYYTNTVGRIMSVSRANGSYFQVCRKVPASHSTRVTDSNDMMNYATSSDPVYWMNNNTLSVYPTPTSGENAKVYYVYLPAVVYTDSNVSHFLTEAEYLVVNYASLKALTYLMNNEKGNLPSDIVAPVLEVVSTSLPTFSAPSAIILPVKPSAPSISESTIDSFSEAPTYTKPSMVIDTKPNISDLTISSTVPSPPVLSNITVDTSSFESLAYTPPVMGSLDFADTENLITVEEDSEMLSSRISEINAKISEYNAKLRDSQNEYNKSNALLQKDLQVAIKNSDLESSDDSKKIQKYSAELNSYNQEVNKEIQEYKENFTKELQLWINNNKTLIQKYNSDIQNELNEFNKENAIFQVDVQKQIKESGLRDSKEARDLQKYQQEISLYAQETDSNVKEFTTTMQKNLETFNSEIKKYQTETSKVSSSNQSILNKFQQELSNYNLKMQKNITKYKWYESQYSQIKGDYNQGIQFLANGGVNPPQRKRGE